MATSDPVWSGPLDHPDPIQSGSWGAPSTLTQDSGNGVAPGSASSLVVWTVLKEQRPGRERRGQEACASVYLASECSWDGVAGPQAQIRFPWARGRRGRETQLGLDGCPGLLVPFQSIPWSPPAHSGSLLSSSTARPPHPVLCPGPQGLLIRRKPV